MKKMKTAPFIMMIFLAGIVSAQQKAVTGYAPVNGLKMYYEIKGNGEPVVLIHGAFMAITKDWRVWINELAKTRKVIAVEMQGHGRTADIKRDITYENLADDVAGLLDYLKIEQADLVGYSLGAGAAMECAIRHPDKVRKVVSISAPIRRDGWVKEANDFWPNFSLEMMKGTPAEVEREKLNPVPGSFPDFFNHIKAAAMRPYVLVPIISRPLRLHSSSSTATPTECGSITSPKCTGSRAATFTATCARIRNRD